VTSSFREEEFDDLEVTVGGSEVERTRACERQEKKRGFVSSRLESYRLKRKGGGNEPETPTDGVFFPSLEYRLGSLKSENATTWSASLHL